MGLVNIGRSMENILVGNMQIMESMSESNMRMLGKTTLIGFHQKQWFQMCQCQSCVYRHWSPNLQHLSQMPACKKTFLFTTQQTSNPPGGEVSGRMLVSSMRIMENTWDSNMRTKEKATGILESMSESSTRMSVKTTLVTMHGSSAQSLTLDLWLTSLKTSTFVCRGLYLSILHDHKARPGNRRLRSQCLLSYSCPATVWTRSQFMCVSPTIISTVYK